MLAGEMSLLNSLFGGIPTPGPSVEEMEIGADYVRYDKRVLLSGYRVRLFDLGERKDREDYEELMAELFAGMQAKTHALVTNDRQIIQRRDGSTGWFKCVEWMEYALDVKPVPTVESSTRVKTGVHNATQEV